MNPEEENTKIEKINKEWIMKILVFWDIFWRKGRKVIRKHLPILQDKYSPDFIIWNSENIAHGKWPLPKQINEMKDIWFDCLTWGNHLFTHFNEMKDFLEESKANSNFQIRPLNYYESDFFKMPGKWYSIIEKYWKRLWVINIMSSVFMADSLDNPFIKIDELLRKEKFREKYNLDWIIVDFHRETTAESYAMSMFLDWRVSFVYWTHTHVQTNDSHILDKWTWMICDIWMTWSLNSMIWHSYDSRIHGLLAWTRFGWPKPEPEDSGAWVVAGCYLEIFNNKCIKLETIRIVD